MINKEVITVVTHSGAFHADDVFACATLALVFNDKKIEFIRSREKEIIEKADIVVDVGKIYDPTINRFDHHQTLGAGERENKIPYASFGLVWKHYGRLICPNDEVFNVVDKELVSPIDSLDNGFDLNPYNKNVPSATISFLIGIFTASWSEDFEKVNNNNFLKMLEWSKEILLREIFKTNETILAKEKVIEAYNKAEDKRIIILDKTYPAQEILRDFPEPLFIVRLLQDGKWGIKTISKDPQGFINKKDLPAPWAGLDGEELQKVSGVKDAVFCHKNLFIGAAESKEGALEMARLAVEY
ncbi:MYG1 family protein [Candidatus Nomurabacteria bacterium]|nr:MYG1 family protein [Candidatus Nomurabacteria bacterium]